MTRMFRTTMLLSSLLLGGCGALQSVEPAVQVTPVKEIRSEVTDTAKALVYYMQMRQLSGADLVREQDAARRELSRVRSDVNRVRYALLLTLPGNQNGEEVRALELLEPVTRSSDSELRGLALLMTAFLQEQRRIETGAQGLQQKLDALLKLERNMTGREGGGARRK